MILLVDWKIRIGKWLYDMLSSVLTGVASGVVLYITDPGHFQDWHKLGPAVAGITLISVAGQLRTSPLPKIFNGKEEV